jgi:hypothetical protein
MIFGPAPQFDQLLDSVETLETLLNTPGGEHVDV